MPSAYIAANVNMTMMLNCENEKEMQSGRYKNFAKQHTCSPLANGTVEKAEDQSSVESVRLCSPESDNIVTDTERGEGQIIFRQLMDILRTLSITIIYVLLLAIGPLI